MVQRWVKIKGERESTGKNDLWKCFEREKESFKRRFESVSLTGR